MYYQVWPALREAGEQLIKDCFAGQKDRKGRSLNVGVKIVVVEIEGRKWEFVLRMRVPKERVMGPGGRRRYGYGWRYHIYEKDGGTGEVRSLPAGGAG